LERRNALLGDVGAGEVNIFQFHESLDVFQPGVGDPGVGEA